MMFARPLRARVRSGEITNSVRVCRSPRVRLGALYRLLDGRVEVTGLTDIDLSDVTDELARSGGIPDRKPLLAKARHGCGERVFLVRFVFVSDSGG